MVGETEPRGRSEGSEGAEAPDALWPALPGGIRLEVELATPVAGRAYEDLPEPFVPLGERGRFSRTLAANVAGPNGGVVRALALRLQSDEYPAASLPGWTNVDVDAHWAAQEERMRAAAAAGAAPAVVDVLPAGEGGASPELPPVLFCKKRRAFFAAPCPLCGGGLRVCRDGGLLEGGGLPRYDASLERFLYCPACAADPAHRFYTLILSDPELRRRAAVGEQADLFAALARLAREGGPLPCHGCPGEPTCYPPSGQPGDAVRYLTPLSFYDFRCLAVERFELRYDEFIARLGGDGTGEPGAAQAHGDRAPGRRYLFEDDPRERLPLEILRLKLAAFAQVLTATRRLHGSTKMPHLGLAPENIRVRLGDAAHGLPSLYRFDVRLLGSGSFLPARFPGLDAGRLQPPSLVPPPIRDASFASSLLAVTPAAHEGALRLTSVSAEGDVGLEGELTSSAFDLRTVSDKDVLHVKVRQGRPVPLSLELIGHAHGRNGAALRLRSASLLADAGQLRNLQGMVGQEALRATFLVHPCLHVACDVESLGLLLFATLLANVEQGPADVARTARALVQRMISFADEHPGSAPEQLLAFAHDTVERARAEGSLDVRHLYHEPERFPEPGPMSLERWWRGALLLGLRALTRVPGFGFCRSHDDFDVAHPEGPVDHFLSEVAILEHSIDEELLHMQGRRREMAEAIRRVREALSPQHRSATARGGR